MAALSVLCSILFMVAAGYGFVTFAKIIKALITGGVKRVSSSSGSTANSGGRDEDSKSDSGC